MSGYLQRLLDWGATLATPATTAAEVAPGQLPGSPLMGFDQRLAAPELAQDFGILGVSPDVPDAGEAEAEAFAGSSDRRARPSISAAPPAAATAPLSADLPTGGLDPSVRAPRPPDTPAAASPRVWATTPADPMPQTVPSIAALAQGPTPEIVAPSATAPNAPAQVAPTVTGHVAPHAPARPRPPEPGSARSPVVPAGPPDPAPAPERPPVLWPADLPPAVPPVSPAIRFAPDVSDPVPVRPAPPAPLEAPGPAGPDVALIERLVREAFARERAQPQRAVAAPKPTAAASDPDAPKPLPRPATAREASVIGDLEPSSRPMTIYGLRRR